MIRPIRKLLVANRGEIAARVIRTARAMGIETVAVFSDADAAMPFVRAADSAVRIGPAPSAESYLSIPRILEATTKTGADAIHPGYGFLSENASFAEACEGAGVVFVGPTPAAIRAMGWKREAKETAAKAGVPVVPGYGGTDQSPAVLAAEAKRIGFPVLLKASAGGGGKGMKLVRSADGLDDAIASARREAESAFGDGTLIIEKYVERPRHVEIQILGDAHGNVVHLFERECSIQRRHQKIFEESPSCALDEAMRAKMGDAAVRLAQAIGYRNAGTVEFIVAPDGAFYFLEVNTRLQVEHPVTELVTGLDLVREQIRVAEGHPLPFAQGDLRQRGWAIEARLYAEDPVAGYLPQSGRLLDFHMPALAHVRVDAGVESGSVVGIHYDPMLAKMVAWGEDRAEAIRRLRHALRETSVQGVTTNRELLIRVLDDGAFASGDLHTHFLDERFGASLGEAASEARLRLAAVAAALAAEAKRTADRVILPGISSGWRNNRFANERVDYEHGDRVLRVEYRNQGAGRFAFFIDGAAHDASDATRIGDAQAFELDGVRRNARVFLDGPRAYVHVAGESTMLVERPHFPETVAEKPAGACVAPMPGKIVQVRAVVGAAVLAGDVLVVMEAMKMEHTVTASAAGTVTHVHVEAGDQVEADVVLAVVAAAE